MRQRLAVAGTCLAYLIATLGLPLSAGPHKNRSQPFPCQNHPCGCQTAEQCWAHCCCFSPEERWAWARANHVEPPPYAEKPAAEGWNTPKLRDVAEANAETGCCGACCAAGRGCCQNTSVPPPKPSGSDGQGSRRAAAIACWCCHGLTTLWLSTGAVLPLCRPVAWSPDRPPSARIRPLSEFGAQVRSRPPIPPPRPMAV